MEILFFGLEVVAILLIARILDNIRGQYEVIAWMPLPKPYKGGTEWLNTM